ncbi:N-acetylmuramoyl-L-alanine amidase [Denitrovibrio acetiphilus DSM 12809]|uniref:N-acetylmuramoyl-L-alanine amidase n=1 Tax=Denitrovibrio acetiphilus (strain DSM 12809 / NBRC 114555 / N2460) TaxID=522772 RepID=D4H6B3_DENA2|nr:N-acetylmuramoyl-L-alanine amidase [Denitrovibrio acetiphilus]ADD69587.1 N-acetylmuramoyl-L-alanine amidase [Denitrovibrio acetiphilus DSM 12809]
MKKLILAIMLILTATAAFAGIEEYQSAKKDLDYIEHSSKVTRKSYHIVADKFHSIYAKDPSGKLADDSLYYTARTYHRSYVRYKQRADLLNALKNFKLLASNYQTRLASLAYIESANLYEEQKDYPSARYMLKKLISRFPNTEDAKTAEGKLAGIEKKFRKSLYADNPKIETASTAAKPEPPVVNSVLTDKENPDDDKSDDTAAESAATAKNKEVAYGSENASSAVPAGKVVVNRVRYFSTEDYTRVVLDLSGQTKFEKHWLKANPQFNKPPRLFLDIEDAVMSSEIPKDINIKDGLLDSLRWGYNRPGVARVVLDSDNVKDFTVFAMSNPDRIVIDVSGNPLDKKTTASSTYVSSTKKVPSGTKVIANGEGSGTLASVFGLKIKTIVIDPGHGGKDPGASYYGIKEKDVVLDVGKELYDMIKKRYKDIDVYMTRNTDVFIPLEARTAFANRKKADLFISVHVNAAPNKKARGVETYVLNVTNDKKALAVAALENQTTQKSMSDLQGILKDIMLNSKLEESLQLASFVQKAMHKNLYKTSRYDLGVKQAPFYVLVGAKMPAVLVEAGFVSNKNEANMLKTKRYRKQIAEGVFNGISSYLKIFNGE